MNSSLKYSSLFVIASLVACGSDASDSTSPVVIEPTVADAGPATPVESSTNDASVPQTDAAVQAPFSPVKPIGSMPPSSPWVPKT